MGQDRPLLAGSLFVFGGALIEYWQPGALVVASVAGARRGQHRWPWVPFCIAFACLRVIDGNARALYAVPVAVLVQAWSPHVPSLGSVLLVVLPRPC